MEDLEKALRSVFESPNVSDANGENANVVDALSSIAAAIDRHTDAVKNLAETHEHATIVAAKIIAGVSD